MAIVESPVETQSPQSAWRDFVGGSWERHAVNFVKLTKVQQRDVINRTFHESM